MCHCRAGNDILINDDCPVTMSRHAVNKDISLSELVLEKIVKKAETVSEIQPALVERSDLSYNFLVRLVRWRPRCCPNFVSAGK